MDCLVLWLVSSFAGRRSSCLYALLIPSHHPGSVIRLSFSLWLIIWESCRTCRDAQDTLVPSRVTVSLEPPICEWSLLSNSIPFSPLLDHGFVDDFYPQNRYSLYFFFEESRCLCIINREVLPQWKRNVDWLASLYVCISRSSEARANCLSVAVLKLGSPRSGASIVRRTSWQSFPCSRASDEV